LARPRIASSKKNLIPDSRNPALTMAHYQHAALIRSFPKIMKKAFGSIKSMGYDLIRTRNSRHPISSASKQEASRMIQNV